MLTVIRENIELMGSAASWCMARRSPPFQHN
jgi:hypothetical protein